MELQAFQTDVQVHKAISERHKLEGDWILLGPSGEVHAVFRVGNAVVRIPFDDPDCTCDTLTEAAVLKGLGSIGFPTPRLLAFDNERDLVPVPYCITEFAPGKPLTNWGDASSLMLANLGSALALLHDSVKELPDPGGWLDSVVWEETDKHLIVARQAKAITEEEAEWVESVLAELRSDREMGLEFVFLHNDVHELNLLVDEARVTIIDWGDAGWGDSSFDFSSLPVPWIDPVLSSYERNRRPPNGMRGRILWNQFGLALRRLAGSERRYALGRRRLEALKIHAPLILGRQTPASPAGGS